MIGVPFPISYLLPDTEWIKQRSGPVSGREANSLPWVVAIGAVSATRAEQTNPQASNEPMKTSEKKKLITINFTLWIVALLLPPLVRILPTGSGNPPKIFELLVPIFILMLAGASTYLLSTAIGRPKDD